MKHVDLWPLIKAASEAVDGAKDWHISGPSNLTINALMDIPSSSVYARLEIFVVTERIGPIFINAAALAKIDVGGNDPVMNKKFVRWPLDNPGTVWVS